MIIEKASRVRGTITVPGDKSIAHRALILGAMARGRHEVSGLPVAGDVLSTMECLRGLGTLIEETPDGRVLVIARTPGTGRHLDAGNSGTTARLMAGFLAGHAIETVIDGDESLRKRPMTRIETPLELMGATITCEDGRLPMTIKGGGLKGITYPLPIPSAQVKSAVLIAGLRADGTTVVEEKNRSRDHTERMLAAMTDGIERDGDRIEITGGAPLHGTHVSVPADVSSAVFWAVAAACLDDSEVYLPNVGLNPTRTGALYMLREMGADIEFDGDNDDGTEPVGDIVARTSALKGVTITGATIPRLIDELPIIAVAATQAEGETRVTGAAELRHKESDRIESICTNLKALGADITPHDDGFTVKGPTALVGAPVSSRGDHRIAMAMAVAGLIADGKTKIDGSDAASISYPRFFDDLRALAS